MSLGVELLTTDVSSCRSIRRSPMDTCPSPFNPRVTTVPVCDVGNSSDAEMKTYGLVALASLPIINPSSPSGATGGTSGLSRGTSGIATANLEIKLPEFDLKNLPKWAEAGSDPIWLHLYPTLHRFQRFQQFRVYIQGNSEFISFIIHRMENFTFLGTPGPLCARAPFSCSCWRAHALCPSMRADRMKVLHNRC